MHTKKKQRTRQTLDMPGITLTEHGETESRSNTETIVRFAELLKLTLVCRSKAYELMNPKSPHFDPTFPVGFPLYDSPRSPKAWYLHEAVSWVTGRATKRKLMQVRAA